MKKFGLYAVTLVALVAAGVAYSAASPSAKLQKQDRLYGGGHFEGGVPNPHNFAVDAHAQGDGSEAVGNSTYGSPGLGETYRSVTCLRVEGTSAVIGGVIERGADAGFGYVQYFVDRGGPGLGARDLASPSFTDPLSASTWPPGFPYVCPSATGSLYQEVDEGDVVVQDAISD